MKALRNLNLSQSGAVLIVSLIMLLLLTMIGLESSQTTLLEEKMAYHMRNKSLAFQAAETAMVEAEKIIFTTTPVVAGHVYSYNSNADVFASIAATSATWAGNTSFQVSATSRYIIQLPPASGNPYTIYGRGTGGTTNAVVMLKSYYNKP